MPHRGASLVAQARWTGSVAVRSVAGAAAALTLACAHDLDSPRAERPAALPQHVAAVVEITFHDVGKPTMTSSAIVGSTVADVERLRAAQARGGASFDLTVPANSSGPGDATIELSPLAASAVSSNGSRYIQATYHVRNAQRTDSAAFNTARHNLTLVAVASSATIGDSPVLVLNRADGTPADPELVRQLKPTGLVAVGVGGAVMPVSPDVLQVFTETEIAAVAAPSDVTNTFPYGFVVRRQGSTTTRTLDASPAPGVFQGVVSIAYKIPLQSSPAADPSTITFLMLALDDSQTRMTQSLEEQTATGQLAVQQRAASLGASLVRLLAGGSVPGAPATQLFCQVRATGPASAPTSSIVDAASHFVSLAPNPTTGAGSFIARTSTIQAAFSGPVTGAGPQNFIVRGLESGQAFRGAAYSNNGSGVVTTPAGNFVPGEEVEVVVTSALSCPTPWVGRLRVQAPTRSSGTVASQPVPDVGIEPGAVTVGDFNADGFLDIATANAGANSATILRGNGAGTFTVATTVPVGRDPVSIVTGDFNGDGVLDLATANAGSNDVTVMLGNGNGTFGSPMSLALPGTAEQIVLGDLNGDGALDLVVATSGAQDLAIFLGNGDGTFQPARTINVPGAVRSVAIGDLNADGKLDLVTTNSGDGSVAVLLGNGDGTFGPAATATTLGAGSAAYVALADVNGDGRLDVVTTGNGNFSGVEIALGNGNGTFGPVHGFASGGPQPVALAIGDMNGDGHLDIVVANGHENTISILLGVGDGTFPTHTDVSVGQDSPFFTALADFNRDGILDVVVGNTRAGDTSLPFFLGRP